MQIISRKNTIIIYLLSFVVPVIVAVAAFAAAGVYPFGTYTAVTGDAAYQFIDYISYLKTVFGGDNDLIYSLSKNLGGGMAGFAAYYYYSPLNLITLLFPANKLPIGLFIIFCMGTGLCSLSMCFSLGMIRGISFKNLIFSYAYGLMGFMIVYIELFHYYTDIILLPLVYLGLKKTLDKRRPDPLYIVSLTAAIICNYYFGYMICIFCALIFLYEVILDGKKLKSFIPFVLSSAASAGISAFVLLPTVLSLRGEKSNLSIGLYLLFNPLDFFSKFYTGSFKGDFGTGLPNVYCGMTAVVLLALFFFNKKIPIKERIVTAAFCIFFWMNFCINTLNVVWHGFNQPIGYPHRFAYIFVFFMLIKASESLEKTETLEVKKAYLIMGAGFLLYSLYLIFSYNENTSVLEILLSAVFVALAAIILYYRPKRMVFLLVLVCVLDLGSNALLTFRCFDFLSVEEYRTPVERTEEMIAFVKERDQGLYRIEKYFRRSHNDAFMHGYAGLSHFSSGEKMSTIRYMGKLGFRDNGNWAFYGEGNTSFADSLLGVKYVLSQFDGTGKPYEKIHSTDEGYTIFENPYALPLLFVTRTDEEIEDYKRYHDPFRLQEDIADSITGEENDILTEIPAEKTYEDGRKVVYEIKTLKDGVLEAYFDAPKEQNAEIYVNGADIGNYFGTYRWNVLDLGYQDKGSKIEVVLKASSDEDIKVSGAYFYTEDHEKLKEFYGKVVSQESSLEKITSSHYKGRVNIDQGSGVVFSVPYDESWRVYSDGERIDIYRACGNLLGAGLNEGEHDLEFKYVSEGQTAGNAVSLLSLIFITLYSLLCHRKKK